MRTPYPVTLATFLEDSLSFYYFSDGNGYSASGQKMDSCKFVHNLMDTTKQDYIDIEYTKRNPVSDYHATPYGYWMKAVFRITKEVENGTVEEYNAVLGRLENLYMISIENFTQGSIKYKDVA